MLHYRQRGKKRWKLKTVKLVCRILKAFWLLIREDVSRRAHWFQCFAISTQSDIYVYYLQPLILPPESTSQL